MATNKSHNKSPVFKMGQLWQTVDDNVAADADETEDEDDVNRDNETMRLRREDMSLFGLCPAWDQFYLVVCEYCKQVIKPQALQRHIELRHSYHNHISNQLINNTLKLRTNSTNATNMPSIAMSSETTTSSDADITENGSDIYTSDDIDMNLVNNNVFKCDDKSMVDTKPFIGAIDVKPVVNNGVVVVDDSVVDKKCVLNNNANKELIETKINIKMNSKLINLLSPNMTTSVDPTMPEPTGPGPGFAAVVSAADSDSVTISVPEIHINNNIENAKDVNKTIAVKPAPKKKSYKKSANSRKLLPCKDRLYDPNKHCGVVGADTDKPCTRSLTCKTHSLTLRRSVKGRIKNFDDLLTEHREAKEAALRAQGIEVKPTKKAIQRQQQQLKASQQQQLKEQNQLLSDKNNLQPMTRLVFNDSFIPNHSVTNSNTNSLLTFSSMENRSRDPQPLAPQPHHRLNQIEVASDGSVHMWCHPRPAAVCSYNIRTYDSTRHLTRSHDLTWAALRSAFNSPQLVSKVTNNFKCSSTQSTNPLKSPSRNTNQLFSSSTANKKLCTSLDTSESLLECAASDPVADPYSFAEAVTGCNNNNNYTYVKPKTTIAKSGPNGPKKKRNNNQSDINCSANNSSLLTNGQLIQMTPNAKSVGNNNTKKKSVFKCNVNNSHQNSCISATLPLTNCSLNSNNSLVNISLNANYEQSVNPSSSLTAEVPAPHRTLNDILSNSMDSNKSDNGSILLNGSLLSCKRSTFTALSKSAVPDIRDSTSNKSIFVANNKFAINSLSGGLALSVGSVGQTLRPIIQKQSLPSSSVKTLSQSQNMSQISQTTNHTIFIKSAKQTIQNQLMTTIASPKPQLLSKAEDFSTI